MSLTAAKKQNEIEKNEKSIDLSSEYFEPLGAIYNPDFKTEPGIVALDNVEKCIAVIEGRVRQTKVVVKDNKTKEQEKGETEKLERQFLPSQLPVDSKAKKREFRHVLKRMGQFSSGPMSVLSRYVTEGVKVKVWTRGVDRVRGVTTGFIAVFDKHWNLAMTDVEEQFTRRRSRKVPVGGGDEGGDLREWRVGESVFRVLKVNKKVEVCVRHVPQVLLRGEHVVMVSPMEGQKEQNNKLL